MKLLKEPLLHFLLIGAALFGLYSWLNPSAMDSDLRILIDDGRIRSIVETYKKTWNREPTQAELKNLVEDFVIEEIYYRQALAMGMDKNDALIRRRLRQKMEFLSSSMAASIQPTDSELTEYLVEHGEKYREANRYSFEQIYINTNSSSVELEQRIATLKSALDNNESVVGDPTLLAKTFDLASDFQIDSVLGRDFSTQLDGLPLNQWSDPLRSGLGIHFINLTERQMGELPELEQVRDLVIRDWAYQKDSDVKKKLESSLLAEYQVIVEWPEGSGS